MDWARTRWRNRTTLLSVTRHQNRPEVRRRVNQRENKQSHSAIQCKVADRARKSRVFHAIAIYNLNLVTGRTCTLSWGKQRWDKSEPWLPVGSLPEFGIPSSTAWTRVEYLMRTSYFLSTLDINLRFHARPEDSFTRLDIPHSSSSVFIIC